MTHAPIEETIRRRRFPTFLRLARKTICVVTAAGMLAACATSGGGGMSTARAPTVGPGASSHSTSARMAATPAARPDALPVSLDIAIPVFDPGLADRDGVIDYQEIEEEGIWPQLRRAEANRFAVKMRRALQATQAFGAVRVVTGYEATADVYVLGRIVESNAEDVEIDIRVVDITNRELGSEDFEHRVSEGFFRDRSNIGRDPYDPVFAEAAAYVVDLLARQRASRLEEMKHVAELRFAQSFAPEFAAPYLETDRRGRFELAALPAENDPMMARMDGLRVQDQLFVDRLQAQYDDFYDRMSGPYTKWQQEALPAAVEARRAREKRNAAIAGAVLLGILGGYASAQGNSAAGALATTAVVAGLGKFALDKSAEARAAQAELDEIGMSLDIEISPQVFEIEDRTVQLSGTAGEQYAQWRAVLQEIHALERTPDELL